MAVERVVCRRCGGEAYRNSRGQMLMHTAKHQATNAEVAKGAPRRRADVCDNYVRGARP